MYADPELDIIEAISDIDKADKRATIPAIINETIIDGPVFCAAACPLNTYIPVPKKVYKRLYIAYNNSNVIHQWLHRHLFRAAEWNSVSVSIRFAYQLQLVTLPCLYVEQVV